MATDASGDVYLVGRTTADVPGATKIGAGFGTGDLLITKMDARLEQVRFTTVIGAGSGGGAQASAIHVDQSGNLYILGIANADDFPYTQHLAPGTQSAFLLKLAPTGDRLVYASQLGNMTASLLDVDLGGTAYVGARSDSGPSVTKVSPEGDVIEYQKTVGLPNDHLLGLAVGADGNAVYLLLHLLASLTADGSRSAFLIPISSEKAGIDEGSSLGIDAAGNLYVSGYGFRSDNGAVSKFSWDGVFLDVRRVSETQGAVLIPRMAVSQDGAVYLFGDTYDRANFPTRNALEPCRSDVLPPYGTAGLESGPGANTGMVVYDTDGTWKYSSVFAGDASIIAISHDGRYLYVGGPQRRFGEAPVASWNGIQRLDLSRIPTERRFAPSCIGHGAVYDPTRVTPGEIMTIFGSNLGPEEAASFMLVNGKVPTELAGTTVTVDGVPAPILYAQGSQINFVVPWGTKTQGATEVCIARGDERKCLNSSTGPMDPAAFRDASFFPIVVYQDGTVGSKTNPVHPGDYISLYLTGAGPLSGTLIDGAVWSTSLQYLDSTVTALITGDPPPCGMPTCVYHTEDLPTFPADVVYAGSAPMLVQGVSQINIRIPDSAPSGERVMSLAFAGPNGISGGDLITLWIAP